MRKGIRKHFFNENYFENIDTEEKAYWLGFISADGSICKSSKYNSYRLVLNLNRLDEHHILKFKNAICANDINIKHYINTKGFSKIGGSESSRLVLNSYKLCMDLDKYNVHIRKSYDIQLPTNINNCLMNHYIRGYFDGDASYSYRYDTKYKRYKYDFELVTGSEIFAYQLKYFLETVGIRVNIYYRKNKNYNIRVKTCSKKEILKLFDYLYNNANIYLERKYEKVKEIRDIAV